ncbi:MAG: hypothetical protein MJE63_03130 [Proteobacteria bacterium]|nr:hypothetical protein [Pseudomonadota bacterium]
MKKSRLRSFLLLFLLFSSLFACITLLIFRILLTKPIYPLPFIVPLILGVVVSFLITLLRRQRLLDLLIDLDTRYEHKELLATAYEYYASKKNSVFNQSLLQEASAKLDSLSEKQVTQRRISSLVAATTGLTILGVVFLFIAPFILKQTPHDPRLNALATRMEEFTNQQPIRILREENEQGSKIFAELRKLAEKIKTQSIEQGNIGSSVAGLQDQVSQERRQIVDSLNQQLQTNEVPMRNALGDEKIAMQELVNMIENFFEDGLPDDLKKQLNELEQFNITGKFLDQMRDELDDLYDKLPRVDRRGNHSTDDKHASKSEEEKTISDKQGESGDQNSTIGSRRGSGNSRDKLQDQLAEQEEDKLGDGSNQFSSASKSKSTGKQNDSYNIASSTEQPDILRGDRGDGDWTDVKIRSSTAIGEVKMKKRLIIRDYQKDLNSVLLKEKFPRKHQQTIKNYFLQIGLEGGEEPYGTTE